MNARTLMLSWLQSHTRGRPSDASVTVPVSELLGLEEQLRDAPNGGKGSRLPRKQKGMTSKSLRRRARSPYLDFVKAHPCCVCSQNWNVDPHHAGGKGTKGTGLKCSDDLAIPLCRRCHDYWHSPPAKGDGHRFPGMTAAGSRRLVAVTTEKLQAEWAERQAKETF